MLELQLKSLTFCPLCGAEKRSQLYLVDQTAVYKCQICGLSYLDPCLDSKSMASAYESSETLKQLHPFHDGYYEYGDLSKDSKTRRDFSKSLDLLEKNLRSSEKKIFEVGFGNGMFLALARQRGWKVDGIDTSEKNVELARNKFGLQLQNGFFEDWDETREKYDAIAMLDVIEHQENPHSSIKKAYAMLREGGLLLLATPNEASLLKNLATTLFSLTGGSFRFGLGRVYFLEHVTYYNQNTLGRLLRANQFDPIESFFSSTDLAKYRLKFYEYCMAWLILCSGKMLGMQNRLFMIGRKAK